MSPDGSQATPPPEEKLLRLIRGAPKPATHTVAGAPSASPSSAGSFAGGRLAGLWRVPSWWLTAMNLGLGCLLVGEAVVLALTVTSPAPVAPGSMPSSDDRPRTRLPQQDAPLHAQDAADLAPSLAASGSRSLFQSGAGRTVTAQGMAPTSSEAKALASRLSLIGIVPGEAAQAIVEDTQTKKTYFVTVGQHVIEGLIVQDIREDRIILNLNGEYIELSL